MAVKSGYLVLFIFGIAKSLVLPVEKCTLTDKSCMKPAFQKMIPVFMNGMPDLGVEVLDVMKVDYMKLDISGLQFSLREGTVKGLKSIVIDDIDWDLIKKMFTVDYHLDTAVNGHYTSEGKILMLPVTGDGQVTMTFKNIQMKLFVYYDLVKTGNEDHIKLLKYEFEFEVKDNAHYHFTNLFHGNKQLSENLLTFVNGNWKKITTMFGRPLTDIVIDKIFKNMIIFFEKMPLQEIANL